MLRYLTTIFTFASSLCLALYGNSWGVQVDPGLPEIPMLLQMVLDSPACVVHQNFTFKVRIVNPNEFTVQLRGFEMDSYIEPEIHLLMDDGETAHLRYHPSDSAWTNTAISVPPGGSLEKHRFLLNDNLPTIEWPDEPGIYKLQLKTHLSTVAINGEVERRRIQWQRPIVQLRVESPNPPDRSAWAWLEPQITAYDDSLGKLVARGEDFNVSKLRIYSEFLERYPTSSYAPAIRWESTKLLMDSLRSPPMDPSECPRMVDLFEQCLTFCLEKGGAYAEEFLEWDVDGDSNRSMRLAMERGRLELLGRIVAALDRRHPDDEPGKLLRHALLAGYRESAQASRTILETLIADYPNSSYTNAAKRQLEAIERGSWPPEAPDEETVLYRAAAKAVYRSPEEGREKLQALLERFPDGRYARQIRQLIDAIDDGTWPPKMPGAAQAQTPEGLRAGEN